MTLLCKLDTRTTRNTSSYLTQVTCPRHCRRCSGPQRPQRMLPGYVHRHRPGTPPQHLQLYMKWGGGVGWVGGPWCTAEVCSNRPIPAVGVSNTLACMNQTTSVDRWPHHATRWGWGVGVHAGQTPHKKTWKYTRRTEVPCLIVQRRQGDGLANWALVREYR